MSHKTEIKTSLTNRQNIKNALTKMGFSFTEAKEGEKLTTKGNYGVREDVDILVHTHNDAVGFRENNDGSFTTIGDFYGIRSKDNQYLDANSFGNLTLAYSNECDITEKLAALGYVDNGNKVDNKDFIEITFEQMY